MLQYLLETITFQLAFLLVYDLFLKTETFFQWNRAYLLTTFLLSLILPWIKLEALKTTVSQEAVYYPDFLWNLQGVEVAPVQESSFWELFTIYEWVFLIGASVMLLWFGIKLYRIQQFREKGTTHYYPNYTKIVVQKSEVAFSFFKQVFLGDAIPKAKEPKILEHELVHIKQWHSLDLLFFELLRIVFWFNPLVYIYQNRMATLHEFIADSKVAKENRKEQYQLLLEEAFQTEKLSFVNQFFKKSLIKKRIVMLTKKKSKAVNQLKYILLLPMVLGMLFYSSCERDFSKVDKDQNDSQIGESDALLITTILDELKKPETNFFSEEHRELVSSDGNDVVILSKEDFFKKELVLRELILKVSPRISNLDLNEILKKTPLPSSKRYESYVDRKKAFQTLDENLKISINAYKENIRSIENKNSYPPENFVLQVSNVRKLQTPDIITFNNKMKEIFETGSNQNSIVIKDGEFAFQVFKKEYPNANQRIQAVNNPIIQEEIDQEFVPFAVVDEVPIFPGCENAIDKKACFQEKIQRHIRKHFNYPQEAQDLGIQGRVAIMFTIDTEGNITNIRKRGPHELLENETERIINRLPKMTPGKQGGQKVNVPFSIPVTFKLDQPNRDDSNKMMSDNLNVVGSLVQENGETFYTGKISDSANLPLSGVTISIKGTEKGVLSDFEGNFKIKAKKGDVLQFQYPGLETKAIEL